MSNKKIILIILAVSFGGCCLLGTGVLVLGALAADDLEAPTATTTAAVPAGGDASLGGYKIFGRATPTAEGFAESLVGHWMLMDGATSIESIETISEDKIRVTNNRSGELWHFIFDADGSYAFRYVVTYNRRALINVEKGEWSSDGAQVTLSPESCTARTASETTDCLETAPRSYALTTLEMEEFTPRDHEKGAIFSGVKLSGPTPKFASGANQISALSLQRVR